MKVFGGQDDPMGRARRFVLVAIIITIISTCFGLGIYLGRSVDQHLVEALTVVRAKIKQKYGVVTSVGQVEAGFGWLRLSEVGIGEPAWLVIDRIDVTMSLNPFQSFLKPKLMTVGRAVAKVPLNADQWPRELIELRRLIKGTRLSDDLKSTQGEGSLLRDALPRRLVVKAARFEVSDQSGVTVLSEDMAIDVNLIKRRMAFDAKRLLVKGVIDEPMISGELVDLGSGLAGFVLRGRLALGEEPVWRVACKKGVSDSSIRCDIDARRLPQSIVMPAYRWVGKGFAPSYRGSVTVGLGDSEHDIKTLAVEVDGRLGDLFVEHPAVALGVVGPFFLQLKANASVDLERQSISFAPSEISLAASDFGLKDDELTSFTAVFGGILRLESVLGGSKTQLAGSIDVDVPRTQCHDVLRSVPTSLVPELAGIQLSGTTSARFEVSVVNRILEVKLKESTFSCDVLESPEIYTPTYLNGPFNIERSLAQGKIYIPVDPARPYFAAYRDIPRHVRSAFVSSEDSGFFSHKGVELSAIIAAMERNTEEGRAAVGGSTITMQTVKNLFLARDKTISRKLQEIVLAWHVDRSLKKERILEIYLNMVEFGPNLYGIGLASQKFFGQSFKQISLKQAVYLASLLPAPIPRYRYFCQGAISSNYNRVLQQLLDRMLSLGFISAAQHQEAIAEPLTFSNTERASSCGLGQVDVDPQSLQ